MCSGMSFLHMLTITKHLYKIGEGFFFFFLLQPFF